MHFPAFWVKERGSAEVKDRRRKVHFDCWGWSNLSLEDARRLALEKVERLAQHLRSSGQPLDRYSYGTRALREEVLRTFHSADGTLIAAITRNKYGCLVLNTARLMFVDIDIPDLEHPEKRRISFLGFKSKLLTTDEELLQPHLARVAAWTDLQPNWAWRIYRTRAGLRLLATHALFDPSHTDAIFRELGADPLYQKLCANQKSFRARLTPKPWRIDLFDPRVNWPWPDAETEARYRQWETRYLAKAENFATCRFIQRLGSAPPNDEVESIVALHDQMTRADTSLPLA